MMIIGRTQGVWHNRLNTQQAIQDKREQDYVDIIIHELCGSYTTRL